MILLYEYCSGLSVFWKDHGLILFKRYFIAAIYSNKLALSKISIKDCAKGEKAFSLCT